MKSKIKNPFLIAAISLTLSAPSAFAANSTWDGSEADANWSTALNWSAGAPGATTGTTSADIATFNTAIANTWGSTALIPIIVDANRNISGLNFNLAADAYFIGSTAGNPLLLSSGGEMQRNTGITGTSINQTINAPLVIQGANGTYSINNKGANSGVGSGILTIGGSISGGAAGATVLNLGGTNTQGNIITGVISNGSATTLAVAKAGVGTWALSNTSNSYSGDTT